MNISSLFKLLIDILKLSRINNLIIILLTQYSGALFLLNQSRPFYYVVGDFKFFLLVFSTIIIAAAGYYINDYYDVKIDLINKPDRVIVGSAIPRRQVILAHTFLNVIGVLMGAYVMLWIGVINLLSAVLLWWYSNRLKKMPFFGNFVVAVLTGTILLVLMVYYRSPDLLAVVFAFFAFGITLIREIIKDIEDVDGDKSHGGVTLPILMGIRRTKRILYLIIAIVFSGLALFLTLLKNTYIRYYFGALSLPFMYFVYLLSIADTKKEFGRLSGYCKWVIIAGIFSMTLLKI